LCSGWQSNLKLAAVGALQYDAVALCQWGTRRQLKQATVNLHLYFEYLSVLAVGCDTAHRGRQFTPLCGQQTLGTGCAAPA